MDIAGFYGSLRIYFSADLATGTTGGVSTCTWKSHLDMH